MKATPSVVNEAKPSASSVSITTVSPEVIGLAKKIAAGEFQQIMITHQMIGQTLLYDGDVLVTPAREFVGAPASASAPVSVSGPQLKLDDTDRSLLIAMDGKITTIGEIIDQITPVYTFKNRDSANSSINKRIRRFIKEGIAHRRKVHNFHLYALNYPASTLIK